MSTVKIDVIIPAYRPGEEFDKLLERLSAQKYPINRIIVMNTEKKFWKKQWEIDYPLVEVHHLMKEEFDHGATRRKAAELSDEGEVQTIAIDKDIVVNAGGTGSADEKSKMQDSQTTEDSQTVQNTEDYIFPNSSSVLLTDSEVSGISKDQLRIGRNEILARHGRRFNDQTLQQYFDSKSWYNGTISPDEFDANLDSRLNDVERANIEIIKKYE